MMPRSFPSIVFAAALAAAPALAQPERPERPYRGLFGGGVGNAEQLLTLNASTGAGYDDNVLADSSGGTGGGPGGFDPRHARSGSFGQFGGSLAYSLNRTRVSVGASAAASSRYYATLPTKLVATYSGSIGTSLQVAKGTRLQLSGTASRQPFLTLGLLPGAFDPGLGEPSLANFDAGIRRDDYLTYMSSVDLTQSLTRRASVTGSYARRTSEFTGASRDLRSWTGAGRFSFSLSRGLGVHAGYGYTGGEFGLIGGDRTVQGRHIDAGVDFSRALSFSRRTTLSFSTGSSGIVDRDRTYYRIIGNARLNREIGRTWNASLAYNRGVSFLETFGDPVLSDAATLSLGGMVNRRLQYHASAGLSVGDVGFGAGSSGFDTYTGGTGVTFGLTRALGLALDYTFYHYAFQAGALLPQGLPREMNRQSLTASLSLWAPLVHRARRPNAAR